MTANDRNKTYGSALTLGTTAFGITGTLYNSDALTNVTLASAGAVAGATVGTYTITPSAAIGSGLGNYTITYADAPTGLTVSPASLTVTAGNRTITYGTSVPSDTLTYSGFISGEDVSNLISVPVVTSTLSGIANVGSYAGNYTVSGASGNYSFIYVSGNLTVLPRNLTVITDSQTIFAGVPNLVLTGSNDLIAQDVPLIGWSYVPVGYSGAPGSYLIGATASDPQNRLANYSITTIEGTLTANPIPSTVVMNSQRPGSVDAPPPIPVVSGADNELYQIPLVVGGRSNGGMKAHMRINIEISAALLRLLGIRSPWAN